jgi:hypothetical protein
MSELSAPALVGLVYRDLDAHRRLLQALITDPGVDGVEFSVGAPLFKGSAAIKSALEAANGLADKIDAYFIHGLVDEQARVAFARKFQLAWSARHPRSERQDIFLASGDVVVFAFDLAQPMSLPVPREAYDAIASGPHDPASLAQMRSGTGIPKDALRVTLRLFLDHALNPRRHLDREVQGACLDLDCPRPFVVEAQVSAPVAGYARWLLDRLARTVGGRAVWLDVG